MSNSSNRLAVSSAYSAVNYLPATLKTNKSGWLIEYYVENPQTQELARKRIKLQRLLNRYSTKGEAKKHINNIIVALNMKLSTGWNPYFQGEESRYYTPLLEVLEEYKEEVVKEHRKSTANSYVSFAKIFGEWIAKVSPNIYCSLVSHSMIVQFMDYIQREREGRDGDISARTYNNYIKNGSAFFTWMMDKCYCKENHFQKIKSKKVTEKKRVLIPNDKRVAIQKYLMENNVAYLAFLEMIYGALLRPHELLMLKVGYISLSDKTITIPPEVSKNGKRRIIPMTKEIEQLLIRMNVHNAPPEYYLFSNNQKPGKKQVSARYFRKFWDKIRKKFDLPMEMQQYSLRDTGITEMLKNGLDPLSVKQLADHYSLSMTTIYSNHADPHLKELIREKAPGFTSDKVRS
ncbi:MAG: tyrosine-type recombinase/integrase [Bacteroidales bacterium]|jgi:site-specific recombinase XerD|nr:tyrosine-type recombinase/integrase [Bacteroidales bacterium]MBR4648465.1 tyrosine-type recombinase/integrase [Bacteroidales bacterium]